MYRGPAYVSPVDGTNYEQVGPLAFDNTVGDLAWSADSKRIYFTADVKGRTPLHELDVATGRIRVITAVGNLDAFQVSADGTFAVLARRRVGSPPELYRVGVREKAPDLPGLYATARQRPGAIRDGEIVVNGDGAAKTLARRTRADGMIETEQRG